MPNTNYNLNEEPILMYFYSVKFPTNNQPELTITECPIQMQKWRQINSRLKGNDTIDYYKPLPNQEYKVPPIEVTEVGKIVHGTNMVLMEPNKNFYIQKLAEEYNNRIKELDKTRTKYEQFIQELQVMK